MDTTKMVIQIFKDVIGVKAIDRQTRFLDVGGNSLNFMEIRQQIKDKMGVMPNPRIFFDKTKSILDISDAIDAMKKEEASDPNLGATSTTR